MVAWAASFRTFAAQTLNVLTVELASLEKSADAQDNEAQRVGKSTDTDSLAGNQLAEVRRDVEERSSDSASLSGNAWVATGAEGCRALQNVVDHSLNVQSRMVKRRQDWCEAIEKNHVDLNNKLLAADAQLAAVRIAQAKPNPNRNLTLTVRIAQAKAEA